MKHSFLIALAAAGLSMPSLNAQVLRDSTGQRYIQEVVPGRTELKFADYDKYSKERIELLEQEKEAIIAAEKQELKRVLENIDNQFEKNEIDAAKAKALKEKAAKIAAQNIDNKTAIIDNHIALVKRDVYYNYDPYTTSYLQIGFGNSTDEDGSFLLGVQYKGGKKKPKYDKRTYSDVVVGFGFGNMAGDPFKFWKGGYGEFGYTLRTRMLKNSNAVRLVYGLSFQMNSYIFDHNQYLVNDNGYTRLETFPVHLKKNSYFRVNKLVAPFFFEFGSSKKKEYKDYFRYDTSNSVRYGVGGFIGAAVSSTQVLRYKEDGNTVYLKRRADFNTNTLLYGLNAYVGIGNLSLFARYEMNDIFKASDVKTNALSIGMRIDM